VVELHEHGTLEDIDIFHQAIKVGKQIKRRNVFQRYVIMEFLTQREGKGKDSLR